MDSRNFRTDRKAEQKWRRSGVAALTALLAVTGSLAAVPARAEGVPVSGARQIAAQADAGTSAAAHAVRGVRNDGQTVSAANANHYETEHFQILWGNGGKHEQVTPELLQESGRTLEACWEVYVDVLKMRPSLASVNGAADPARTYKMNVIVMETGLPKYEQGWAFAGIDSDGYPYIMAAPGALRGDSVLPHELGHAIQFAHGQNSWRHSGYLGPWYEPVANWFREEYVVSQLYKRGGSTGRPELTFPYLAASSLTPVNGRAYYEAWPILKYLEENPDDLAGYGTGFVAQLLASGNPDNLQESFYELLARTNPKTDIQTAIGRYAAHMATFDFREKKVYNNEVKQQLQHGGIYWQQLYTMLNAVSGEPNTYAVPAERAPQAAGYNVIPLDATIPAGQTSVSVKATLNGSTQTPGAGWTAYLVAENASGVSRYSESFESGGSAELTVHAGEKAYVSVAATPTLESMSAVKIGIASWNGAFSEKKVPFESKPQYPYTLKLDGAQPQTRGIEGGAEHTVAKNPVAKNMVAEDAEDTFTEDAEYRFAEDGEDRFTEDAEDRFTVDGEDTFTEDGEDTFAEDGEDTFTEDGEDTFTEDAEDRFAEDGGSAHPNGGGFVANGASVDESVYVGPNARVLDRAVVKGTARIEDRAVVRGEAKVGGSARITNHALVQGGARVEGSAVVSGYAIVDESALVKDQARVGGQAIVRGEAVVSGNGQILESAQASGFYEIGGNAVVKGLSLVRGGSRSAHGGAQGDAVTYGDFFDDQGYTLTGGAFSGYQSVQASVNTFKDGYAKKSDGGYERGTN